MTGELTVEVASTGEYRWMFVTSAGAEFHGPKLYKTKAAARKAGELWLAHQKGSL